MEAEGTAMRPGPRVKLVPGVLTVFRRAIVAMEVVSIQYRPHCADEPLQRLVCPYGILYGGRGWLVGHAEGLAEMRLWRLDRVARAELTDKSFLIWPVTPPNPLACFKKNLWTLFCGYPQRPQKTR
jgi:predicted DNA-binding transcriptional regulator YafY